MIPEVWRRPTRRGFLPLAIVGRLAFAPGCGSDDPSPTGDPRPSEAAAAASPEAAPVDHEALYRRAKDSVEAAGEAVEATVLAQATADLREVAQGADDAHLRANASLLLGSLLEEQGDRRTAISYYRQARAAVPEEASAHAMLALALAAEREFEEAAQVQSAVVARAPDDLEAWLLLGEMRIKAGQEGPAKQAYAGYEMRRKGLIDGLTAAKDGDYLVGTEDRAACAGALEPAADTGTAMALLVALASEPDAMVRAEIARVMGAQRLAGYRKGLEDALGRETENEVREMIQWALTEIARDPVETAPGPAPMKPPPTSPG